MNNYFDLYKKTVLITGGLGFIGGEVAKKFLELECKVHILDLIDEDQVALENKLHSKNFEYHKCDVSNYFAVDEVTNKIYQSTGSIDVLFNNAASKSAKPYEFSNSKDRTIESEVFREVIAVNVQGLFNVTSSVSEFMKKQKSGSIIHTSSIYGSDMGADHRIYERNNKLKLQHMGSPAVYNASKAAVIGLTKYFASCLGQYNIRVNSISPGGVYNGHSAEFIEDYSNRVPMGRMAQVHEISGPVIFLASSLSSYVNGLNLYVDGGLHAW